MTHQDLPPGLGRSTLGDGNFWSGPGGPDKQPPNGNEPPKTCLNCGRPADAECLRQGLRLCKRCLGWGNASIFQRRWSIYQLETDGDPKRRAGAYCIAAFPTQHANPLGLTICVGPPRSWSAGIYPPAVGAGGIERSELEKAFLAMAAVPELLQFVELTLGWFAASDAKSDAALENFAIVTGVRGRQVGETSREFIIRLGRRLIAEIEGGAS